MFKLIFFQKNSKTVVARMKSHPLRYERFEKNLEKKNLEIKNSGKCDNLEHVML